MIGLFLLLLLSLAAADGAAAPPPSLLCALNGYLDPATGRCVCYQGWRSSNCTHLAVSAVAATAAQFVPAYGYAASTSWGGGVIFWPDGGVHLFVDEMQNNCGLHTWRSNSQVSGELTWTAPSQPSNPHPSP